MGITKLLYGDCMEWLPKLPEGQASLILADLPYNITAAEYDKNIIPLPELWQEYKRILQPGGIVALFASQPFTTKLINSIRHGLNIVGIGTRYAAPEHSLQKCNPCAG